MAQMMQDNIVSLWTQGVQAVKDKSHCSAVLTAKELSIVWGSDSRYWKWVSKTGPVSCEALDVAQLIEVCWLQIDGKYNASNLNKKGGKYEVYFVVELSDNLCMQGPVTLKLTKPDGKTVERKEDLHKKPRNTWVGVKVGEFTNPTCGCENIVKFSMNGCDGTTWKTGLTVIGAAIVPVIC